TSDLAVVVFVIRDDLAEVVPLGRVAGGIYESGPDHIEELPLGEAITTVAAGCRDRGFKVLEDDILLPLLSPWSERGLPLGTPDRLAGRLPDQRDKRDNVGRLPIRGYGHEGGFDVDPEVDGLLATVDLEATFAAAAHDPELRLLGPGIQLAGDRCAIH